MERKRESVVVIPEGRLLVLLLPFGVDMVVIKAVVNGDVRGERRNRNRDPLREENVGQIILSVGVFLLAVVRFVL